MLFRSTPVPSRSARRYALNGPVIFQSARSRDSLFQSWPAAFLSSLSSNCLPFRDTDSLLVMETISQVRTLEQLSVLVTLTVIDAIMLSAGQSCVMLGVTLVMIGFVWSVTVTVVVQGALRLPAASVAVSPSL